MPLLLSATPAFAQVKRAISVKNECKSPLRLYISHADGYRNWHVHGPYNFDAFEGPTRLENNNVVLTQTEGHSLYFYAESLDGKLTWDGDHNFDYNGATYGMKQASVGISGGELNLRITCN